MSEANQILVIALLWAIWAEVTDNTTLETVAWIVATIGFAIVVAMACADAWLAWRERKAES